MEWVAERAGRCLPPVLEVGSYDVNGSVRPLFPEPYTGMDMREGPGVDLVANVLERETFAPESFATIITTETLEHVSEPAVAVENMASWLAPGGQLIVTVPFMLNIHDYPCDYWRMTYQGLGYLLERAGLEVPECVTVDTHTYARARKPG